LVAGESEDYLDIICPSTDTAMVTTDHYKTTDIVEKTVKYHYLLFLCFFSSFDIHVGY
jgi:hypothetical protein